MHDHSNPRNSARYLIMTYVLYIIPYAILVCVGLVLFLCKERIMNYFKRDLEAFKTNLLRQLEEYRMGIDVRRNLSIQMSDKRLLAYQETLSINARLWFEISRYRQISNPEERKLREDRIICDAEDGCNAVIKNYLYLPGSLRTELRKMDVLGKPILNNIQQNKPVTDAQFERFTQQLKVLKDKMVSEIEDDTSDQTLLK